MFCCSYYIISVPSTHILLTFITVHVYTIRIRDLFEFLTNNRKRRLLEDFVLFFFLPKKWTLQDLVDLDGSCQELSRVERTIINNLQSFKCFKHVGGSFVYSLTAVRMRLICLLVCSGVIQRHKPPVNNAIAPLLRLQKCFFNV